MVVRACDHSTGSWGKKIRIVKFSLNTTGSRPCRGKRTYVDKHTNTEGGRIIRSGGEAASGQQCCCSPALIFMGKHGLPRGGHACFTEDPSVQRCRILASSVNVIFYDTFLLHLTSKVQNHWPFFVIRCNSVCISAGTSLSLSKRVCFSTPRTYENVWACRKLPSETCISLCTLLSLLHFPAVLSCFKEWKQF